jgi:hypothetical protein
LDWNRLGVDNRDKGLFGDDDSLILDNLPLLSRLGFVMGDLSFMDFSAIV